MYVKLPFIYCVDRKDAYQNLKYGFCQIFDSNYDRLDESKFDEEIKKHGKNLGFEDMNASYDTNSFITNLLNLNFASYLYKNYAK